MKIFLVETDDFEYDEYDAFIVRAKDEAEALKPGKQYAQDAIRGEITVVEVKPEGESKVILASFNAG